MPAKSITKQPSKPLTPAEAPVSVHIMEQVLLNGDLSKLSVNERLSYYKNVCESLELNPLTKPFDYIMLNGKLTLYARKDCTEQLRRRDKLSIKIITREVIEGVYVVTAQASGKDGRVDESIGCVSLEGTKGEARSNAMMKAETKAKRRVTLSISGLGILDEEELDDALVVPLANGAEAAVRQAVENTEEAERLRLGAGSAAPETTTQLQVEQSGKETTAPEPTAQSASGEWAWKEVICHIGLATGPLLGKEVGKLPVQLLVWLRDKWAAKLNPATMTAKDKVLKNAVEAAIKFADAPAEDPTREEVTEVVAAAAKEPKTIEVDAEILGTETFDWQDAVVFWKCNIQNKKLGELSDAHLRAVKTQLLPRHEEDQSLEARRFRAALALAIEERGLEKSLDELRKYIAEKFDNLVLTEEQGVTYLKQLGVMTDENMLEDLTEGIALYLYQNWPKIEEALKDELKPKTKPKAEPKKK